MRADAEAATSSIARRVRGLLRGDSSGGTLARGALWSLLLNVVGAVVALVVQVLLARSLGREHYGLYLYALAWMNVALLVGKLELDTAAIRFIGAYVGTKQWALLRGFVSRSRRLVSALSIVVALAAALTLFAFSAHLSPLRLRTYLLACALLPLSALLQLEVSSLQGLKRVLHSQGPSLVLRPLVFGVAIFAFLRLAGGGITAADAVALQILAAAVAYATVLAFRRRYTPAEARHVAPLYETQQWVSTALGLLLISAAQVVLSSQADVLVVGTFLGTSEAGAYGSASQLAAVVGFGVSAVMFIALPFIAELYAQGRTADLQLLIRRIARVNFLVAAPFLPALAIFGKIALSWYGPSFVSAYPVLLILGTAQLVGAAVGGLAGYVLTMTGYQSQAGVLIAGSAALNLALTAALTPLFGTLGTAGATLLATTVRSVILAAYIRRHLRLQILPVGAPPPPAPAGRGDRHEPAPSVLRALKRGTLQGMKGGGLFRAARDSVWRRNRLLILGYRGIALADEDRWDPMRYMSPHLLRERMTLLAGSGCTVLPLGEALERLRTNDLPDRSVVVTFDRGFADFKEEAVRILREFGFPATVYLSTFDSGPRAPVFDMFCSYLLWIGRDQVIDAGPITESREQWDLRSSAGREAALSAILRFAARRRLSAAARDELATTLARALRVDRAPLDERGVLRLLAPADVAELTRDGVDVQLYAHREPALAGPAGPGERELFLAEIREHRERIAGATGTAPVHFCYANGRQQSELLPWLREAGVVSAATSEPGLVARDANPLLLPRLVDSADLAPVEFEGWLAGVGAFLPRSPFGVGAMPAFGQR